MPDRADPRLGGLPGVSFEDGGWIRIETEIARHRTDRKRMAVARTGGRRAVTRLRVIERFGPKEKPIASLVEARLETGRTHQIRVHASYIGHSLIGDPVYGRPRLPSVDQIGDGPHESLKQLARQALHANVLGFEHPISGESVTFCTDFPDDMHVLLTSLRRIQ